MRRTLIVAALALGCGGPPAPKPPAPSPAVALANQLEADLAALAELAHRHAADCAGLLAALRPHVEQMKRHAGLVEVMLHDPGKARELQAALADRAAPARTDQIAKDLGGAYLGCADAGTKYELEKTISAMPTFE